MIGLSDVWPGLLLLLVVPPLAAMTLRAARMPGWRVAGGLLAGLMLGPSIMGLVWPDQHERWLVGGGEAHQALQQLERQHQADLLAMEQITASETSRDDLAHEHERSLREARQAVVEARWKHQRPLRWLVVIAATFLLLSAGMIGVPRSAGSSPGAVLSIGLGQLLLPGGIMFFMMFFVWEETLARALLVAAAAGIGPWALGRVDREVADDAEHHGARLVQSAGRVASVVAIGVSFTGIWLVSGWSGVWWMMPLAALLLGWLGSPRLGTSMRDRMIWSLELSVVPIIAAAAVLHINLFEQTALWPTIVLLLVSADGRWLGAFVGAIIPGGRQVLSSMRLVLGSMAAGPTQLAVAALAAHAMALPGEMALALAVGALMIEITTPARRGLARRIIRIEEEIDRLEEES